MVSVPWYGSGNAPLVILDRFNLYHPSSLHGAAAIRIEEARLGFMELAQDN